MISRHCEFLVEDRLHFLVQSTKEDIMTFLTWILDYYPRVRKRSSLHEYWRLWCMLYRKSVGRSLHAKLMEEVSNMRWKTPIYLPDIDADLSQYINGYLTTKYNLDTTTREKPVMNVNDIYLVLHHHWILDTSVFPDERQRL